MAYNGVVPLDFKLDPYQKKYIDDDEQMVLVRKSRRIGMSWAAAYKAVTHSFKHNVNIYYLGPKKDMTQTFIKDCGDIAEAMEVIHKKKLLTDQHGKTKHTIKLTNGFEIQSMSSKPDNIRSKGKANELVIIDEAAYVDDLSGMIKAATPILGQGAYIHIISTERGSENTFHKTYNELVTGKRLGSVHTVTLDDALRMGHFKRLCRDNPDFWLRWKVHPGKWSLKKQKAYREWLINQVDDPDSELFCIPIRGLVGSFLAWEDIEKAQHDEAGLRHKFTGGRSWLGVDVASERHDFVITAAEEVNETIFIRQVKILSPKKDNIVLNFRTVLPIIDEMANYFNVDKIIIDATGHGEWFGKEAIDKFGKGMVSLIKFNQHNKMTPATHFKDLFQQEQIKIPSEDSGVEEWEYIIDDLKSMSVIHTENGPKLKPTSKTNHNDIFTSMMLAVSESDLKDVFLMGVSGKPLLGKSNFARSFLGLDTR